MSNGFIFSGCKTGTDFEVKTVEFLRGAGFTASKTGRNDGGIDIIATKIIHETEYKYYIQCKYYNTTMGKHPIQEIYAGAHYYEATSGKGNPVVITNNAVTREARVYAKQLGVEIIADAEWAEIREVIKDKGVTDPNQYHGLKGLIVATILKIAQNPQAEKYLADVIAEPELKELTADKEELILSIQSEFDDAEEYIKESARLYQRATQNQQKAMSIHRDIIIRQIKYG